MLADIGQRCKQVMAYYYTGNRTHGSVYKQIIIDIKKAEEIGLQVHGVISDMGASNQSMWRAFNIYASRYSTIQNKCIHPCDQNRSFFFMIVHMLSKILKKEYLIMNLLLFQVVLCKKIIYQQI